MHIVDSSGWIEYFTAGLNADFFADPILAAEGLIVPAVCFYEVFKRILVERDEDAALLAAGLMSHGQLAEMDRTIAIEAARISVNLKLAMADSIILATAQAYDARLWTQDAHFKGIQGIEYIESRPRPK
jgi:predicted nucleic acid-binding protein